MRQLTFSFSNDIDIYNINNFIVYDGNRDIFDFINSSFLLNNNLYLLTGPKSSGKTYICNIWYKLKQANFLNLDIFKYNKNEYIKYIENKIEINNKYILEGLEEIELQEEFLLYLFNVIINKKSTLLITSKKYINDFSFSLPDLNSRFKSIFNFTLKDLDNDSKQQIILKLLIDRQINIDSNSLIYLSKKISGNYSEILSFIEKLDDKLKRNEIKKININILNQII